MVAQRAEKPTQIVHARLLLLGVTVSVTGSVTDQSAVRSFRVHLSSCVVCECVVTGFTHDVGIELRVALPVVPLCHTVSRLTALHYDSASSATRAGVRENAATW